MNKLAVVYMMKGSLILSDKYATEAIALSTKQLSQNPGSTVRTRILGAQFNALHFHSMHMTSVGLYDEALSACREELKTIAALGPSEEHLKLQVFNQLALISNRLGDNDGAVHWTESAFLVVDTADHLALSEWHLSHGTSLDRVGQRDSAISHLKKVLALNDPEVSRVNHSDALIHLWAIHMDQRRYADAQADLLDYETAISTSPSPVVQGILAYMKGRMLFEYGSFAEAISFLVVSDSLAVASGIPSSEVNPAKYLTLSYAALGDVKEAGRWMGKYDDLLRKETNPEAIRALATYRAEMLHEKELALEQTKLSSERRKRWFAWWVAGGSLLLCGVVLFSVAAIRKRNRSLAAKNAEILSTRDELVKSERMREASELRTRIARDLHDEIGSELTRLVILGNELKRKANEEPHGVAAVAEDLRQLTKQVGVTMSDVVWAVDPSRDSVSGLMEHAERSTSRMVGGDGPRLRASFAFDRDIPMEPEMKHNLFMVLKEAINNALKHANATEIEVAFEVKDGRYTLRVADNGHGFDREAQAKSGNGLRNMKARADRLGALFELNTTAGQGTEVRLSGVLV
jgi:signal transduction histidine kinase